jgi:hypothetical protein
MMMNQSYEQQAGLLPNGHGQYATTTGPLYGSTPIPTLLGNDGGTTPGDYLNDHPVGPAANVQRPELSGIAVDLRSDLHGCWQHDHLGHNWQLPDLRQQLRRARNQGMVVDATNQVPYVVCTTCHNQHQMNVYNARPPAWARLRARLERMRRTSSSTLLTTRARSWTPTAAPSTTQFCRQCHFGVANEAFGVTSVGTAY